MEYANCSFCNGQVIEEFINTEFWWGEKLIVFKNVPAGVCKSCGEQYFDGKVYDAMTQRAQTHTKPDEELAVPVWDLAVHQG